MSRSHASILALREVVKPSPEFAICGKKGLKDQDAQDVLVLIGHVDTDAHVLCASGHADNPQAGSRNGIAASRRQFMCQGLGRIGA